MLKKKLKELNRTKFIKMLLGKHLHCKYVTKKHSMEFVGSYWVGQKPWMTKIHINRCKHCGHYKKIAV